MRILQAVRLIRADYLALPQLWAIATKAERIQVALILGLPGELPKDALTPELAWRALASGQRKIVLAHASSAIRARLPAETPGPRIVWQRRIAERPESLDLLAAHTPVAPCPVLGDLV